MTDLTPGATINAIAPFFIAGDVPRSIAFYRDRLGFALTHAEGTPVPFFALVQRDGAMLFLKSQTGVEPMPTARAIRSCAGALIAICPIQTPSPPTMRRARAYLGPAHGYARWPARL